MEKKRDELSGTRTSPKNPVPPHIENPDQNDEKRKGQGEGDLMRAPEGTRHNQASRSTPHSHFQVSDSRALMSDHENVLILRSRSGWITSTNCARCGGRSGIAGGVPVLSS